MEDNSLRAIIIGVTVFIAAITISLVVFYYSAARKAADNISDRTNIAEAFDAIVNTDIIEDNLTGVEVRSLIKKYVGSSEVIINILTISGEDVYIEKVNNSWKIDENINIISEEKLDMINPVWQCSVDKVENEGSLTIELHLNVGN